MRTGPLVVGRVLAVVLGVLLVLGGLAAMVWSVGLADDVWPALSDRLSAGGLLRAAETIWWPWVLAAFGVLLALLALWWLTALVPPPAVRYLDLPGTGPAGHLRVSAAEVANAAARTLTERTGGSRDLRESRGQVVTERGRLVVETHAPLSLQSDLTRAAEAADRSAALLHDALGRDDLLYRAVFHLPGRRSAGRVQ